MIQLLTNLLVFLVSVLLLVTVHEFGHFWVAKRLGVKVVKFSIGFGRALWRWQGRSGTEYAIAVLPLGGYVRLLDERDGTEIAPADLPRAFNRQSLLKRALIILAGPGINVLFAILIFWIMWMIGVERMRPVIGEVIPNSIAAESGFPAEAEILSIDDQPASSWPKITMALVPWLGESGDLHIKALPPNSRVPKTYTLHLNNWHTDSLQPDPLKSLGLVPWQVKISPVIGKIQLGAPAATADLRLGDTVLEVAGQKVKDWQELIQQVRKYPEQMVQLIVERAGQPVTLNVKVGRQLSRFKWVGYLGVEPVAVEWPPGMISELKFPPAKALLLSLADVQALTKFNFVVLGKMLIGRISMKSMGGPISIYQSAGFAFKQGLVIYLGFLGILSVTLAFVNILPIPGLDGGHLLFFAIEAIIRRPLSTALQALIVRLGFIFLIVLIVQASINDIFRSIAF